MSVVEEGSLVCLFNHCLLQRCVGTGVRKQRRSGHLESATCLQIIVATRVLLPAVHFWRKQKEKWKGGGRGGYLSRGVCRSRNQCSVNSSLKLAHIEEGFGHVIANLSAISFCFCCTGVFWSIGHKLLAGKTNGRGMLTRRGLRLPAPLPPPSLVLLQSTCTFLCWEVWLCYREEWGKKKFLQTLSKERL